MATPGKIVQKLPAQPIVTFSPALPSLVHLFLGDSAVSESLVVSIGRADLHVGVTDDLATACCRRLRDEQIAVRQPYHVHRRITTTTTRCRTAR